MLLHQKMFTPRREISTFNLIIFNFADYLFSIYDITQFNHSNIQYNVTTKQNTTYENLQYRIHPQADPKPNLENPWPP